VVRPRRGLPAFAVSALVASLLLPSAPALSQSLPVLTVTADYPRVFESDPNCGRLVGSVAQVEDCDYARFTLHADPAPTADLSVSVLISGTSAALPNDRAGGEGTGLRTVTVPAGRSSVTFRVAVRPVIYFNPVSMAFTTADNADLPGSLRRRLVSYECPVDWDPSADDGTGNPGDGHPRPLDGTLGWKSGSPAADDASFNAERARRIAPFNSGDWVWTTQNPQSAAALAALDAEYFRAVADSVRYCGEGFSLFSNKRSISANIRTGRDEPVAYSFGARTVARMDAYDKEVRARFDPVVGVSAGSAVIEGGTALFTVNAYPEPSRALTVNLRVTQDGDFVAAAALGPKTVMVPTSGSVTYTVSTAGDSADEPDGSVTVTIESGNGYDIAGDRRDSAAVTVRDDDDPPPPTPPPPTPPPPTPPPPPPTPVVSFASAASSADEAAGTQNVSVNLVPAPPSAVTLGYTVAGSATSGSDFEALSGSAPVSPGTSSLSIPVTITDDDTPEGSETVELTLTGGEGYTVGTTSVHTLTITDNDSTSPPPRTQRSLGQNDPQVVPLRVGVLFDDVVLELDEPPTSLDLAPGVVGRPDRYSALVDDPLIVAAVVSGSTLSLIPGSVGTTTVSVSAGNSLSVVSQSFQVTVNPGE